MRKIDSKRTLAAVLALFAVTGTLAPAAVAASDDDHAPRWSDRTMKKGAPPPTVQLAHDWLEHHGHVLS